MKIRDVLFAMRSALMAVTKGTPHDKRNVPQFTEVQHPYRGCNLEVTLLHLTAV